MPLKHVCNQSGHWKAWKLDCFALEHSFNFTLLLPPAYWTPLDFLTKRKNCAILCSDRRRRWYRPECFLSNKCTNVCPFFFSPLLFWALFNAPFLRTLSSLTKNNISLGTFVWPRNEWDAHCCLTRVDYWLQQVGTKQEREQTLEWKQMFSDTFSRVKISACAVEKQFGDYLQKHAFLLNWQVSPPNNQRTLFLAPHICRLQLKKQVKI